MLEVSVQRQDLADEYGAWVNRALVAIQADNSYNCMRHLGSVTITSGTSSVRLPADFKEFVPAQGAIAVTDATVTNRSLQPCELVTREKLIRIRSSTILAPTVFDRGLQVFETTDGDTAFLNTLDAAPQDLLFTISYFRYLPPLAADDDQNYLTRTYEDMVQARTKAVAFSVINDPLEGAELAKYEIHRRKAVTHDARLRTQGRINRMGGG